MGLALGLRRGVGGHDRGGDRLHAVQAAVAGSGRTPRSRTAEGTGRRRRQPRMAGLSLQPGVDRAVLRSEEHTSELQSLMRISYAVFCLKKNNKTQAITK